MNSGHSTLYLPIPQCNTDSEEEELHSGPENHVKTRPIIIQKTESGVARLDEDHDIVVTLNGFHQNDLTVVNSNKPRQVTKPPLSCRRRIALVASIALCFIIIFLFLWVLPCGTCSYRAPLVTAKKWETPFPDLEIYGPISVVDYKRNDLIVLLKPPVVAEANSKRIITAGGRLTSLFGTNGTIRWNQNFFREPTDIDCSLIDVNRDGVSDCIVIGTHDLFKAIEPISGNTLWEFYANSNLSRPVNLQFPLVLPDLNGDGIDDLLVACSVAPSIEINQLVLVSGANGLVLGRPVAIKGCSSVSGLFLEKDFSVSFTCVQILCLDRIKTKDCLANNSESVQLKPLSWITKQAGIKRFKIPVSLSALPKTRRLLPANGHVVHIWGCKLALTNSGVCPESCQMDIVVKDYLNNTVYNRTFSKVFGMAPVTLSFQHLSGFVLKLWQWSDEDSLKNRRVRRSPEEKNNTLGSKRRRKPISVLNETSDEIRMMSVSENIILIPFVNGTKYRPVNVSQQEITLLCKANEGCQPRADSQIGSLLIADLDLDGSRELVTYTAGYYRDSNTLNWKLLSKIRVVRLEAELPQLFEL